MMRLLYPMENYLILIMFPREIIGTQKLFPCLLTAAIEGLSKYGITLSHQAKHDTILQNEKKNKIFLPNLLYFPSITLDLNHRQITRQRLQWSQRQAMVSQHQPAKYRCCLTS